MVIQKSENVFWQQTKISKQDRQKLNQHKSFILWFTGLSGAGKTSLAVNLEQKLFNLGMRTYILDGDNVRQGINKDLAFDKASRVENIRRIGEVSKLILDAGTIVLSAFISPFQNDRDLVRSIVEKEEFIEIFVDCPLAICEERDTKGLYKKARRGEIKNFTGIDSEYEIPKHPDIVIDSHQNSIDDCTDQILHVLKTKSLIL
ncbi:adenylyl-sulfate kinase [bacterium K02(2017)]|nr:adenylyl-sulfate kinase [bacterium K02(2017)]